MWASLASFIIRQRIWLFFAVLFSTGLMAFFAKDARMSYAPGQVLPSEDSTWIEYQNFRSTFGEEANAVVMAVDHTNFFDAKHLVQWQSLEQSLRAVHKVDWTLSLLSAMELRRNDSLKNFESLRLDGSRLSRAILDSLPFYESVLWDSSRQVFMLFAGLDEQVIHTEERERVVSDMLEVIDTYERQSGKNLRISGLPFIRTETIRQSSREIVLFILLAALVTSLVLWFFFRSLTSILVPLAVVGMGVVWSSAIMGLFGYMITSLTGLIPPLLIVIGIPNAVYLINKYHQEYQMHHNKMKALSRMVYKSGKAIFLTNLTTATGFGTLVITNANVLVEFGIVAFLSILVLFVLSLVMIPVCFSFLPPPGGVQLKHLKRKGAGFLNKWLVVTAARQRKWVFALSAIVAGLALAGAVQIEPSGKISDDIPRNSPVFKDLTFFEQHFEGVMPFEVMINTGKPRRLERDKDLWERISDLQDSMWARPGISRPVSMVELIKYSNQALYKGSPDFYALPSQLDMGLLRSYLSRSTTRQDSLLNMYVDSTRQFVRIRARLADVGTYELNHLSSDIGRVADKLFEGTDMQVSFTGASVVMMKATDYLVRNLFVSLLVAMTLIAVLMSVMFKSPKMVLISLIPNLLPLLFTAGAMGWLGIPLKASTSLIFSVAFGISVDDTIHFLSRYRQELWHTKGNIRESVYRALGETGLSMTYTSIILFFGFSIFMASEFGGTVALGMLVSLTLLVAMFTNLTLLPAMLIGFQKKEIDKNYAKHGSLEPEK